MVLTPAYDHISWKEGGWFTTSKQVSLNDTLEYAPRKFYIRNTTAELTGLLFNGKTILAGEPFEKYEIIAGKCIAASCEKRGTDFTLEQFKKYGGSTQRTKFFSLFNLEGKNLYPANFRRLQKIDSTGTSTKDKRSARYILFWGVDLTNRHSLFVFDADKQDIADWLISNARMLRPDNRSFQNRQLIFTVTDKDGMPTKQLLDYNSGKFVLTPVNSSSPDERQGNYPGSSSERVEMVTTEPGDFSAVPVPEPAMEDRLSMPVAKFNAYYQRLKDSLFYVSGKNERSAVTLPAGTTLIYIEPRGMNQYLPVIARLQDKFYIIHNGKTGTTVYDSLVYFGSYFLAWKTITGQSKAGVINAGDSALVPFEYDSIYAGIRFLELKDMNPAGKSDYQVVLKEADSEYNYSKPNPYSRQLSDRLTVFKKGKAGVISMKGYTIIPVEYELIAQNHLQHSRPMEDKFIILQQNGRYGLTDIRFDKTSGQNKMINSISPQFTYIPGFYYRDYFGIKNFRLFGLYNNQFEFMGYASEKGMEYFKD